MRPIVRKRSLRSNVTLPRLVVKKVSATLEKMLPCYGLTFAGEASSNLKSHSTKFGHYPCSHFANTTPAVHVVHHHVHVHVESSIVCDYSLASLGIMRGRTLRKSCDHRSSDRVEVVNPFQNSVTRLFFMVSRSMATREVYEPTARFNPAFISTPRHLYLWGGRTVTFETGSEDASIQLARCIEQYDPYLEVWRQLNTTGTPHPGLYGAACASVADKLYMYGGNSGKRLEGVLSLLSLKTLTWSQLCQEAIAGSPMRKSSCGMVSLRGDQLAVIGGYGIPTGPTQHGASFIRDTNATDGRGWTNEVHIFNINQGIVS